MFLHGLLGRSIPSSMCPVRQADQGVASPSRAFHDRVFGKFLLSKLLTLKHMYLIKVAQPHLNRLKQYYLPSRLNVFSL